MRGYGLPINNSSMFSSGINPISREDMHEEFDGSSGTSSKSPYETASEPDSFSITGI